MTARGGVCWTCSGWIGSCSAGWLAGVKAMLMVAGSAPPDGTLVHLNRNISFSWMTTNKYIKNAQPPTNPGWIGTHRSFAQSRAPSESLKKCCLKARMLWTQGYTLHIFPRHRLHLGVSDAQFCEHGAPRGTYGARKSPCTLQNDEEESPIG